MLMTRQECPLSLPALLHLQKASALVDVLLRFLEPDAFEAHIGRTIPSPRLPRSGLYGVMGVHEVCSVSAKPLEAVRNAYRFYIGIALRLDRDSLCIAGRDKQECLASVWLAASPQREGALWDWQAFLRFSNAYIHSVRTTASPSESWGRSRCLGNGVVTPGRSMCKGRPYAHLHRPLEDGDIGHPTKHHFTGVQSHLSACKLSNRHQASLSMTTCWVSGCPFISCCCTCRLMATAQNL